MPNKELNASVKLDISKAESSLKKLEDRIKSIDDLINKQSSSTNGLTKGLNNAAKSAEKLNQNIKKSGNSVGYLTKKVKGLASAYLGVMGVRALITTSDTLTSTQNQLNNLPGGNAKLTQSSMDKVYGAAQRSRGSYTAMLSNVGKTMTLAGGAFQNNIDNAIRFQEIMSKAYTIGGASAAEQSSSMYQLVQALGSGVLQGDELRSVREGAAFAYKEIEKFAQSIYGADKNLKDLASDGLITSDIVVAAIMSAENRINEAFNNTKMTFSQAWNYIRNVAVKSFEPVFQMLNSLLRSDFGQAVIKGIGYALQFVANVLLLVGNLISKVYNFIADNWSTIKNILVVIGSVLLPMILNGLHLMIINLSFTLAGWLRNGVAAVASGIKAMLIWTGVINTMGAVNWTLVAMIAIFALIVIALYFVADSFADACGIILGIIMAAFAVVWNLFLMLVALVIQSVLVPLFTAWDTFANFFGNLFNDPITAIIRAFEGLGHAVLGILQTIANGIDSIFGSNLADAVSGWSSKLSGKADELVEKYGNGTYEEKSDSVGVLNELLHKAQTKWSWNPLDAYAQGYEWGTSGANWLSDKLSGLGDKLGFNFDEKLLDPYDPSYALGSDYDPSKALKGIKGDTGKLADGMDLTNDDLEYLRRIADMEWKKEFTTANITVDMSNYNTINGDGDLDGIVTKLSDKLREELNVLADGVYAY